MSTPRDLSWGGLFCGKIKEMKRYNPVEIEAKWQKIWSDEHRYEVSEDSDRQKYYVSCMFPYPSGAGMHVGHVFEHVIVDSVARFRRQMGYNVLNPMGWDSFGLPAENYAIKTGIPPAKTTKTNIHNFIDQLKMIGLSIDWSREINTSDPQYYRWTQWIFSQLFKRGLAYQKESLQWWCPKDKTVLANEQVVGGRCWRCDSIVEKRAMKQWFFKITDYADELLAEIPSLDWPEKIKTAQTNWIGRSEGAEIVFDLANDNDTITVFSTRPDTIFGATFLVLSPEHPLVKKLVNSDTRPAVEAYVQAALKKSEIERMSESKEKTGIFTGSHAINPATGEKIQIWVADYVLSGYGTGAVMAVPAHDERDFAFAEKFGLPVIEVIERPDDSIDQCYQGEGTLVNSGAFNGMRSEDAREQIVAWLEQQGKGSAKVTYKMHDWLISRQRYWGAPIPIIHCPEHGAVAVPDDQLPVVLPEVEDYEPKGDGKSVLARATEWVNTICPTCGGPAKRETDTMDGFACSSWYLLRYTDPHNDTQPWDPAKANYWAPLDMYVGGDHATAHLLYVRFWTHVFHDMGLTDFDEPVKKLVYHGLIGAEDGRKMSKSLGNTVDPRTIVNEGYGADTLRVFELFLGPVNEDSHWSSKGIAGIYRFLNRVWTITNEYNESDKSGVAVHGASIQRLTHKTIKKVTEDYYDLGFNTAIAALMEYVNELYKLKLDGFAAPEWHEAIDALVRLLAPMAPHIGAELWEAIGNTNRLEDADWPTWDKKYLISDTMTIVVQVNGKLRAKLELDRDTEEAVIKERALLDENVQKFVQEEPKKVIYVKGKLVSIVV